MKLFNNLRKKLVRKLIRPEDGYIRTGNSITGETIKLCRLADSDLYMMVVKTPLCNFHWTPTLAGWSAVEGPLLVEEVSFQDWAWGILSNLTEEYSERLNNISMKELRHMREFKKNENGEGFVLNRQSFCDIMEALDGYWGDLHKLEGILNVYFEDNMLTEIYDSVVNALVEDLEPDLEFGEDSLIQSWLIAYDAGRNDKAKEGIDGHPLTNAGELYDYLVWKRDEAEKTFQKPLDKPGNMW